MLQSSPRGNENLRFPQGLRGSTQAPRATRPHCLYDAARFLIHGFFMPPPAAYIPDDAQITLAALEYLRTPDGTRLRQAIADLPSAGTAPTVAQIAALRRRHPAAPIHAALTLAKLQPKAAGPKGKFPGLPYVWATPEALEQATHARVAKHKATRFAQHGAKHIYDLCAGIGGDALALAQRAPVTAVELSPVRALCLRFNAQDRPPAFPLEVRTENLENLIDSLPPDTWIHIDPSRRSAGRRSPRFADLIPGPDVLERIFTFARAGWAEGARAVGARGARVRCGAAQGVRAGARGAVKLSPAVDFASLPPGHLELISHEGTVVQALLWLGTDQTPDHRTATILSAENPAWSLTAAPRPTVVNPIPPEAYAPAQRPVYLYELDGALTRAALAQDFAEPRHLLPLTIDGGYLLSPPGSQLLVESPLTPFRVHAIVPFGQVQAALARCAGTPGVVEVKARGRLPGIDTDELQRLWTKARPMTRTVLLFGHKGTVWAAIAQRV